MALIFRAPARYLLNGRLPGSNLQHMTLACLARCEPKHFQPARQKQQIPTHCSRHNKDAHISPVRCGVETKPACAVPKPNRGLLEAAKICQIAPPKLLSLNQD
jgi:hypothetical protein